MGSDRRGGGVERKPLIILDTNMLMLIAEGVNVFEQIEEKLAIKPRYIVLKPVMKELEKLASSGKPGIARKALFAKQIAEKYCEIVDVEKEGNVDDIILEYAREHNAAVATNDRELRRKLREKGIPEIYIREESMRIDIEGLEI